MMEQFSSSEDEDNSTPIQNHKRKEAQQGAGTKKPKKSTPADSTAAKAFQCTWLQDPQFKGWLEAVPGDGSKAKCLCCNTVLNSGKSDLQKHAGTEKHKRMVTQIKECQPIRTAHKSARLTAASTAFKAHSDKVKELELRLSAYFAEHNVAFYNSDHLIEVIKIGATDSAIVKDLKLGRRKCSLIVSKVLVKTESEELSEDLRKTFFSVLIDESTDVSNNKNMCVLVRYVSPLKKVPVTTLLELIKVDAHDCSAVRLWDEFKKCLSRHSIPVTNVIGLGCDNASMTTGQFNSFWSLLKATCPYAILLRCICHTSALVTKHAIKMLPSYVVGFLTAIPTYVNDSPKQCAELHDFQELYEEKFLNVLKPAQTRWLALYSCIKRYLEIDKSLLGFLRTTVRENPNDKAAKSILNTMLNPYNKAYLLFLEYALIFLNEFNALFQSREVLIHTISESSKKVMTKLCQNFVQPSELNNMHSVNFSHPSNLLSSENVYVGPACSKYFEENMLMERRDPAKIKNKALLLEVQRNLEMFRLKCREFYSKAAEEMQSRLPLNSELFREMAFLDPKKLLSPEIRASDPKKGGIADLSHLGSHFQELLALGKNALALEWRTIPMEIDGITRESLLRMSVSEACVKIFEMQNYRDQPVSRAEQVGQVCSFPSPFEC